jgi:hypothetical protein
VEMRRRSEERRCSEERRMEEDRRRAETVCITEKTARERALAEHQRKVDMAATNNRDRWAHRQEMAGARDDSSANSFATTPSSALPHQPTVVSSVNPGRDLDPLDSNAGRSANTSSIVPLVSTAPMGSCVPPSAAVAIREISLSTSPFQNGRNEMFLVV